MTEPTAFQLVRRGRDAARGGNLHAALIDFERAVRAAPHLLDGWYLVGVTLAQLGRHSDAAVALERALMLAPDRIEILGAFGYALFHAGRYADAEPVLARLCRARPMDPDCELKRGECLSQLGDPAAAALSFRNALARMPDAAGLWVALGEASEESGNRADAEAAYEQALVLWPEWPRALAALLNLSRSDALVARAQAVFDAPTTPAPGRAMLGHALGKVHDSAGAYERAMACWREANAIMRAHAGPFDRAAHAARIQALLSSSVATGAGASDDPRPVFVVGMPRSGTTLVEQIIAAHGAAAGCGEMRELVQLATRSGADFAADAAFYLAAAAMRGGAHAARLVDKQPLNLLHLDRAARMFRDARVIWCRRDPRDVGVSIFGEQMAPDTRFATDLADIAYFHESHVTLMQHWQRALPLPILEVSYEALVTDFEPEVRRIIEFLELEWDPACLAFHAAAGAVQTPSRWQVRRPVSARSIGRWRNYERWLGPLITGLGADRP